APARRGAGARTTARRLQRAHAAVRRAGPRRGAAGPFRRGTPAGRRPVLLPRLGRGLSGGLGGGGPDVRSIPRRRRARAVRHRRPGPPGRADAPDRAAQTRGAMIRLENLTKHYGSFVAVVDISLEVPRGVLYGFLGPNGAGKTTTLRMIAGILRPTDGRVLLGGDNVHDRPLAAKMRLGFIPDRQFVSRGGTVLMSTHTLEVAEAMCDRVAIIQHGKIVADGAVDDLRRQHRAGDATLEELFLKLTGGARVRELVEVLGGGGAA